MAVLGCAEAIADRIGVTEIADCARAQRYVVRHGMHSAFNPNVTGPANRLPRIQKFR
jgi:hypothetical protein